ncbi:hypothetical protein NEIG_00763 [Nematocida sp. ERTm5]|nr:hypothetical protein NEIG_00763 [Nematocida sp. ERTm5]
MDGISDDRTERAQVESLIKQIITLEEDMYKVQEENRALKESIIASNRNISDEIIRALTQEISNLRQDILNKPEAKPTIGCVTCASTVSTIKTVPNEFKKMLYNIEQEISRVLTIAYSQSSTIQEKNKQLELYAQINAKLMHIKDHYMKSRNL